MKLIKRKANDELLSILKELEADYIEPNWMYIKNEQNIRIGEITGYRVNIPLIINDILSQEGNSANELVSISQLCSDLWCAIEENIEMFTNKPGELFFLNRIGLYEPNGDIEIEVLEQLKEKYEFIIYSIDINEPFDKFTYKRTEIEYLKQIKNLDNTGWVRLNSLYFFYKDVQPTIKDEYIENQDKQTNYETPFENWLKHKGVNWLESLWKGILRQTSYSPYFEMISTLQKENKEDYDSNGYIDAVKFMRNLKIFDFIQHDSRNSYIGEPPALAKDLRSESLYVTYKRKKYIISFTEDFLDENKTYYINFGTFDKESKNYCFGCKELFDSTVESWVVEIYSELFERAYCQYTYELKYAYSQYPKESLFLAANKRPILITRK